MGMSSGSSSSKPVDMTPDAFKNLQPDLAKVLGTITDKYLPGGVDAIFNGYDGKTTAPVTGREQNQLDKLNAISNNGYTPTKLGAQADSNSQYQALLKKTANAGMSTNQATLNGRAAVANNPTDDQTLAQTRAMLGNASQTGAFGGAQNPYLDSYVSSAQRQTQQALEESLGRTLPGRFAMAGQQVQPQSSSAFDRAAAIATRGASDTLGDIATNINYQAYDANANREAAALDSALGRKATAAGQTQALQADATQNAFTRALQAPQIAAGLDTSKAQNQLTNAQTNATKAGVTAQQADTMVKNLQAQALPRLVQDMGIERGMDAFNQRVNSLLSTLGITAGVTRPVIANSSQSSQAGFNLK